MKKLLIMACILAISTGCASTVTKRFSVIVDPPGSDIAVIPGGGEPEQKLRAPADVKVAIPKDPAFSSRSRIEIRHEAYKPKIVGLSAIVNGETLKIKLEPLAHYALKFRMTNPVRSDSLRYRDKIVDINIQPRDRSFLVTIQNLTRQPIKILWEQSEYVDYMNRHQRLIFSSTRPQDRNASIPPQIVPAGGSVQRDVLPVSAIAYSQEKKSYQTQPLFPLDGDSALSMKGRTLKLFLPIEMDRAIIPDYDFIIEINDVVRE